MSAHKRWSAEEDQQVKSLALDASTTINEMAIRLGVHRNQLMRRMKKLGVSRAVQVWTQERNAFLISEAPTHGFDYCATKLGLSAEAVRVQCRRLGVSGPNARTNYWTADEDRSLMERRAQGVSFSVIAAELHRTQEAARYRSRVLRARLDEDPGQPVKR